MQQRTQLSQVAASFEPWPKVGDVELYRPNGQILVCLSFAMTFLPSFSLCHSIVPTTVERVIGGYAVARRGVGGGVDNVIYMYFVADT